MGWQGGGGVRGKGCMACWCCVAIVMLTAAGGALPAQMLSALHCFPGT